MRRCYDPRRMSTLAARTFQRFGRLLQGVAWTAILAVLAASGAGIAGQAWHAPGSPARAELTYPGDATLDARLDAATEKLKTIAAKVTSLAQEAKTALGEVASTDPTRLREALLRGGAISSEIDAAARALRTSLTGLPGDEPFAAIEYSNATLVRRAAILAAIDAATGIATRWQQVTGRAVDAAQLVELIASHDLTVLDAAAKGRASRFKAAIPILDEALLKIEEIQLLRVKLIAGSEPTVLDEWIARNTTYDRALQKLYATLVVSKGEVTVTVQSARREERDAFAQLPPDRRTIIVIVSEVARGGLTQAVLGIEEAHGRIDDALAEAG
jgi:hypothetical protein